MRKKIFIPIEDNFPFLDEIVCFAVTYSFGDPYPYGLSIKASSEKRIKAMKKSLTKSKYLTLTFNSDASEPRSIDSYGFTLNTFSPGERKMTKLEKIKEWIVKYGTYSVANLRKTSLIYASTE